MNFLKSKTALIGIILFIITIVVIAFFDKALASGIILIGFLTLITFLVLSKTKTKSKTLCLLFIIALLIHFGAVLFIHYANFQPFSGGGGDYLHYDYLAKDVAQRIHQGDFSFPRMGNYYPLVIAYVYALTFSEMLIGQLFGVWLAALSVLFVYLIILEIGGTKKQAFLIGLITSIYPAYLFFGSLLLKDVLVIPLILAGLLLALKLIKNFSWRNFLIFYIILTAATHLRFYVGYALLFTFIPCWLLLSKLNLKKKFINGIIIIILLGFIPQFLGHSYYGFKAIKGFMNPRIITFYRETAYAPLFSSVAETPETPGPETPGPETPGPETPGPVTFLKKSIRKIFPKMENTPGEISPSGRVSTMKLKTEIENPPKFLMNCLESFLYTLLGPFPWQMRTYSHLYALLETIPWYFLLFFIIKGSFISLKRKRIALPLLVFSIISLGILSLFVANLGTVARIRMPSFIALLCLIPLGFERLKS